MDINKCWYIRGETRTYTSSPFTVFNSWFCRNGLSKLHPGVFHVLFYSSCIFFFFLEGKTPRESVFIPLVEQFKNQPFFQLKEEEKRKKKTRAEKERISAIKKTRRRTNTDSIWNVTSSRIVSHCKQKRSFRSHFLFFFFFLNGKRAGFPLVFREYGTGRCCSARRIFRSTVIFTRVVAPQWILLLPRLLTISKPLRHPWFWSAHPLLPLPPWAYHSALRLCHCSKSLYREPLHCFLFFFFFFPSLVFTNSSRFDRRPRLSHYW